MTSDPIVQEVRRVREALARQGGNDLGRIFSGLREREAKPDARHPLVVHADLDQAGRPGTAVVRDGE